MDKNNIADLSRKLDLWPGRGEPELDLFEIEVENEFKERMILVKELYGHDTDLYMEGVREELNVLIELQSFFEKKEEYERCSRLHSLHKRLEGAWLKKREPRTNKRSYINRAKKNSDQ